MFFGYRLAKLKCVTGSRYGVMQLFDFFCGKIPKKFMKTIAKFDAFDSIGKPLSKKIYNSQNCGTYYG